MKEKHRNWKMEFDKDYSIGLHNLPNSAMVGRPVKIPHIIGVDVPIFFDSDSDAVYAELLSGHQIEVPLIPHDAIRRFLDESQNESVWVPILFGSE